MKISVRGIGWLANREYGCVRRGLRHACEGGIGFEELPKNEIFSRPVKNFGRFDTMAKMTCAAVSLALRDAGMAYSSTKKQDIGIIGSNTEGSLRSDIAYFKDYIGSGRTLSRGNLFIYTLPSSPLGEAAIHFGFLGPLLYVAGEGNALAAALDTASEMILAHEAPVMLAGKTEADEAMFFVLGRDSGQERAVFCGLEAARALVEGTPDVAELARKFSPLNAGKA